MQQRLIYARKNVKFNCPCHEPLFLLLEREFSNTIALRSMKMKKWSFVIAFYLAIDFQSPFSSSPLTIYGLHSLPLIKL